jgi:hypothetical protein
MGPIAVLGPVVNAQADGIMLFLVVTAVRYIMPYSGVAVVSEHSLLHPRQTTGNLRYRFTKYVQARIRPKCGFLRAAFSNFFASSKLL